MRARLLRPEFFTDAKIAKLGPWPALVYQALWCLADDGGTAPCDPDLVFARMFYRWGTSAALVPEITGALQALSETGRIKRYRIGDEDFAVIPTWHKHQQVHKPSKFRFPKPLRNTVPGGSSTAPEPVPGGPHPLSLVLGTTPVILGSTPSPPELAPESNGASAPPAPETWQERKDREAAERVAVVHIRELVAANSPSRTYLKFPTDQWQLFSPFERAVISRRGGLATVCSSEQ